jgi:hypothetical protein
MTSRGDTRTLSEPHLEGFVAPGYEPVRRVFVENFRSRHEVGAAMGGYGDARARELTLALRRVLAA